MILILAMYINETVMVVLDWYLAWLAYVKYGGSNDRALSVILLSEESPLTVINIVAVNNLFVTVRIGIADSIMVFHFLLLFIL